MKTPKKKRIRKGFFLDLILLVVFMTAPLWATALLCSMGPLDGIFIIGELPFILAAGFGLILDAVLFTVRFMGEKWW